MFSDGRFWFGVIIGAGALYGYQYWRARQATKA